MSHSLAERMGGFFKFAFGKKSIEGQADVRKGSVAEGIEKTKGALIFDNERNYEVSAFEKIGSNNLRSLHILNNFLNSIS